MTLKVVAGLSIQQTQKEKTVRSAAVMWRVVSEIENVCRMTCKTYCVSVVDVKQDQIGHNTKIVFKNSMYDLKQTLCQHCSTFSAVRLLLLVSESIFDI